MNAVIINKVGGLGKFWDWMVLLMIQVWVKYRFAEIWKSFDHV